MSKYDLAVALLRSKGYRMVADIPGFVRVVG